MSVSFGLSNFKGFKELESVELKPLTVICGTNNSGKSSLIQSLLLMKQSNVENIKIPLNTHTQEPLIFNGLYTHLGSYLDVVHGHSREGEIKFSWKVLEEKQKIELRQNFSHQLITNVHSKIIVGFQSFEEDKSVTKAILNNFVFHDFRKEFLLEILKLTENQYQLNLKNIHLDDLLLGWIHRIYYGHIYSYSSYGVKMQELYKKFNSTKFFEQNSFLQKVSFNNVQVKVEGIFPTQIIINNFAKQSCDVLREIQNEFLIKKGKVPKYLSEFIETTISELESYMNKQITTRDKNRKDYMSDEIGLNLSKSKGIEIINKSIDDHPYFSIDKEFSLLDHYISYKATVLFLRNLWSGFRYIGPIREEPKRFYLFDDLRRIEIGINGEYTALVLAVEKEIIVPKYYRCIYDKKQIIRYELREQDTLIDSVNWWLYDCMKLPKINSVNGLRGVINQVKLNSSGIEVDLPDVGFGVSQILPILVECLRIGEGETLILEQPEIHLHPSLQSKLADFFICMVKSGKKLVVETHSEHLINRLCLRIAQEESNEIQELINVLFISFDEKNQTSVFQPIEINQYGEIENWPVGFFDENDSRDLLAATLKKRMSNI
ncbi:MAG TPA: DUF3696 domain-containing protein [Nostocaceae cyanobacterium]|nr:DUF3696 domain-containing protein [Nostocaceae cyanobacterium]